MTKLARLLAGLAIFGFFVIAAGRAADQEFASASPQGKAEYGYGQIRYGGKGPEAWRWETVQSERQAVKLQRRLTVRVLQVQSLRREVALLDRLNLDPILAIRVVFGPYADEAIRVSSCETGRTFYTGATNGQYLGLFQMGSYARSAYGHSSTALGQARAAYAYFVASGRDWSPWECKP